MPTITQHVPGTFCWPELSTTDPAAAKTFYATLFGWTTREQVMEQGSYYMFDLGGRGVAAMTEMSPEMRAAGVPPHWNSYVSVENADATVEKVRQLGGQVVAPPFDVMEHGRMAVLSDPGGAVFCLWQPKAHVGVGVLGEPGSLAWTQLNAKTPGTLKPFYEGVLGWTHRDDAMPQGGGSYTTWLKSDGMAGGMMPIPANDPAPPHWLVYFAAASVDDTTAAALALGAKSLVPPTDIPGMGRFSVLTDPLGAAFALVKFAG